MAGRYYDEFLVGELIVHSLRRTITEADNVLFCAMTHNTQPLHLDAEYARQSEFGQRLVNSLLTLSLLVGIGVSDITEGTLIANLAINEAKFPLPVFHGDTLHTQTRVLGVRRSNSRPNAGIVEVEHQAFNQRDELVAICRRTMLMHGRAAAKG
jgi:acyl dehydratase